MPNHPDPTLAHRRPIRPLAVAAAVVLLFVAGLAAPWQVAGSRIKDAIGRELAGGYGVRLTAPGQTTIALLPTPRFKLSDVTLADERGAVTVRAAQLRAELRLLPLLIGRLEPSSMSLSNATVTLRLDPERDLARNALALARMAVARGTSGQPRLSRLVLIDSQVRIEDGEGRPVDSVDHVNIVANWPGGASRLRVGGSVGWRDQTVELSAGQIDPASLAAGGTSPITLDLSSARGRLGASGEVAADEARFTGKLSLTTPSVGPLASWLGVLKPLAPLARKAEISGDVVATPGRMIWSPVTLGVGQDRFTGTLGLTRDGDGVRASGTLAGDTLDLGSAAALWGDGPRPFGAEGSVVDALRQAGLDLRLSAGSVRLGGLKFGDVALAILSGRERLEVSLGRASLNGGSARGRLSLTRAGLDTETKLLGSVEAIDLAGFLSDARLPRIAGGQATGQMALESVGPTRRALMEGIGGRAALTVRRGDMPGVSVASALRPSDAAGDSQVDVRGGRTSFDQVQLLFAVIGGVFEIAEGSLDSADVHARLEGRVSVPDSTIDVRARLAPPSEGGPDRAVVAEIDVNGPVGEPRIAAFRTSGQAARVPAALPTR